METPKVQKKDFLLTYENKSHRRLMETHLLNESGHSEHWTQVTAV